MSTVPIDHAMRLALEHHQAGRLAEAESIYRQVLAAETEHVDALHLLGVIANQRGDNDVAVELIRKAVERRPNYPEAYSNLGNALKSQGDVSGAIAAYRSAIQLKPDYAVAHYNLGNVLKDQGQLDQAVVAYRTAIQLKPDYAAAHSNLGNALKEKGQVGQAIAEYRIAIQLKPGLPEVYNHLGNALTILGRLDEAIPACRIAIQLKPDAAEAHYNLGNALKNQGKLDQAIVAYRTALQLKPGLAFAQSNLGDALKDQGELDQAIAAYRTAIELEPGNALAHSNLILAMTYHPRCDATAIASEARRWNDRHAQPLAHLIQPHTNDRTPARRLKIGYVSPDFREHPVGRFMAPLQSAHDREQFDIFAYAQVASPDAVTQQLQSHADQWRSIVGLSDEQVAQQIRADGIDILVDLALHTANNRLLVFARKPAPVQVTFGGYPGTTGLTTIDYRLSDPYLDPPGMDDTVYSERTIRLPDSFWCYDPLSCREIPVSPLPASSKGFVTFGCLNNFCKINDEVLRLWAQVMLRVPQSRLLLLVGEGEHRQRVKAFLQRKGIDPQRVEFASRCSQRDYLALYHGIDLSLDSFPYNGHTTSLDSCWMGVPVVTLVGERAVARAGWCQLSNLSLTELAAHTPERFIRIAVDLAGDLPRLTHLRTTLRDRMNASPLMDAARFARNVEPAYRQMWRTWCERA